tara:strand:+ start:9535 stop:11637 length:2103 start_codon:yes stop_codon:yes gene_type:complete
MIIQLYIAGQRVELFKDESVTITDSIQNVKDIDKVFTSFSQSFSVPSSKSNNKLFKHYYNFDITNGFDARKKVDAIIELNNVPFKTGKIKLEGVDLKNNKAHTYRITFFGDIVELKDKLGEKKLSDLNFSSYQPLNYDPATVEAKLSAEESSTNHIIAPLITHSQRLYYDTGADILDDGNLHWHGGGGTHIHGVKWNELKYAIRVNKIIEAIETDFDLSFSSDFFKNTSIREFDHLFMWLHRKSGAVEDLSGSTTTFETIVDGWTPTTITSPFTSYTYTLTNTTLTTTVPTFGSTGGGSTVSGLSRFEIELETTDVDEYDVALLRDGTNVFNKTGHQGDITISADPSDANNFDYAAGSYTLVITSTAQISFTDITWYSVYEIPKAANLTLGDLNGGATGAYNTNSSFTFNIEQQIPEMKIIDFLTGLFKLFNLTAFVENGVIQVKPLDDFYTGTNTYDITEFVDVDSSKVNVALPFKEVLFKFKDTKSFLANKFSELNNRTWGEINYNEGQDLASKLYKIEAPFGHMLYERLNDAGTGAQKNIQWGYSVDSSQNPYLGSPLLFYPAIIFNTPISFVDAVNDDNVAISHKEVTTFNRPSNSVEVVPALYPSQLNFNREINEWTGSSEFYDSLYIKYYSNYISSVFNEKQRLTKIKAYLPMRILLNYGLGDRFIVAGNQYKINSISTNLLTGESNIELLNDL